MPFALSSPIRAAVAVKVTPAHRFFDCLSATIAALGGYYGGIAHRLGLPASPDPRMQHVCFVEQVEIRQHPGPVLDAIAVNAWPSSFELGIDPMPSPPAAARTSTPQGSQRVIGDICAHAFLTYYENALNDITAKHGGDRKRWPEVLKMARMARNAFGHGGKLEIRDPNATASWRSLSLTYANNGEQMLYNHVTGGDLILLMLDMEDML